MFDKLLRIGGTFDYITPTRSLANQARGKTSICTGTWEQMQAVERAGIHVTNVNSRGKRWTFDVPREDERQARRIMRGL